VSGGHSRAFDVVCDVLEQQLPARREVSAEPATAFPDWAAR